jgi:hypothetical protein
MSISSDMAELLGVLESEESEGILLALEERGDLLQDEIDKAEIELALSRGARYEEDEGEDDDLFRLDDEGDEDIFSLDESDDFDDIFKL